jgi:hypothetical protein
MASQKDVRRIALSLPGVREGEGRFAFSVENKGKLKGFVWSWAERVFFTEPHYNGFPAVLVRLPRVYRDRSGSEPARVASPGDREVTLSPPVSDPRGIA